MSRRGPGSSRRRFFAGSMVIILAVAALGLTGAQQASAQFEDPRKLLDLIKKKGATKEDPKKKLPAGILSGKKDAAKTAVTPKNLPNLPGRGLPGNLTGRTQTGNLPGANQPGKNLLGMICMICGLASVWRVSQVFRGETIHTTAPLIAHGTLLAMVAWLFWQANSMTSVSCFLIATGVIIMTSFRAIAASTARTSASSRCAAS